MRKERQIKWFSRTGTEEERGTGGGGEMDADALRDNWAKQVSERALEDGNLFSRESLLALALHKSSPWNQIFRAMELLCNRRTAKGNTVQYGNKSGNSHRGESEEPIFYCLVQTDALWVWH